MPWSQERAVVALNFRFCLQRMLSFLRMRLIRQMPTWLAHLISTSSRASSWAHLDNGLSHLA